MSDRFLSYRVSRHGRDREVHFRKALALTRDHVRISSAHPNMASLCIGTNPNCFFDSVGEMLGDPMVTFLTVSA